MGIAILITVLLLIVLIYAIKAKLRWVKLFVINALIIVGYNIALWTYIFTYLDTGGASLGPGLLLMAFTCLHIFVALIYCMIRSLITSKTEPIRNHIEILDETLELLRISNKTQQYEYLKTELADCFMGNEYAAKGASILLYYRANDAEIASITNSQLSELLRYCDYNFISPKISADLN